jgi:hypothetical protein
MFGLGRYRDATEALKQVGEGKKPEPWKLRTTAQQLAHLAHLHASEARSAWRRLHLLRDPAARRRGRDPRCDRRQGRARALRRRLRASFYQWQVTLVDDGVHDNQGTVSLLASECNVVLVSDACGQLLLEPVPPPGLTAAIRSAKRSMDTLMERVRLANFFSDLDACCAASCSFT